MSLMSFLPTTPLRGLDSHGVGGSSQVFQGSTTMTMAMTAASTVWAPTPASTPDDLWLCLASEEPDDGVFSVLNLDHDRFLEELDQEKAVNAVGAVCGRLAAMKTQPDAAGGDNNAPGSPVTPGKSTGKTSGADAASGGDGGDLKGCSRRACKSGLLERMRSRMAADVSRGRGCSLLRANINAVRRLRSSPVVSAGCGREGREGREWRAAAVLQAAWRRFVLRHAFLHLREVVRQFAASGTRGALQSVNPREAHLADAASDIVVRFRLAGDDSSLLPVLVYKMFTRRPVVDVCRGCCGRLLDCSGAGAAAYATAAAGTTTARSAPAAPAARSCVGCRSQSVCCLLFASYKRVENNDWRHCHLGLFDPERCPARGVPRGGVARTAAKRRPAKRATPGTAPGALSAAASWTATATATVAAKKKLSVQEKERLAKITLLRKLYGYGQGDEIVCPPPSPSLSSKRPSLLQDDDVLTVVPVPDLPDLAGQHVESAAEPATGRARDARCPEQPDEQTRVSDAYYDRLMASWGL
ncbi:uncharacterized protein LOC117641070 [Thrips palmi]|uniref:Uncharacterized protein LOC117641070 n=1 Tax=Thrips palmi TaxID=161013 RepID=A0A6P8YCK3_THRPL|nr:uncharacterized protein LOC117641070 [Thrips palmi]